MHYTLKPHTNNTSVVAKETKEKSVYSIIVFTVFSSFGNHFLNMNLTIDIGNTRVKTAFFKGDTISRATVHDSFNLSTLKHITQKKAGIKNVILCTVKDYPVEWKNYLQAHFNFIEFSDKTPLPLKNKYVAPKTLGKDRLACAVAAHYLFPNKNVLSVNAGTCITYDFTGKTGTYSGGGISPGLDMRFKALHTFTGRLPLIEADIKYNGLVGTTTEESIRSGVQQGMLQEINGIINAYRKLYKNLHVVVSGGSLPWLEKHLDKKINREPFLVLKGLNVILAFCLLKNKR